MSARRTPGNGAARRATRPGAILFRVAGSARIGYGHLVRAIHLARALGVPPRLSIRGSAAAVETARRLGAEIETLTPTRLASSGFDVLLIDDPSAAAGRPWLRAARRAGMPVVSLHDRGIAPLPSDLVVDGQLTARRRRGLGRRGAVVCLGPRFAVLGSAIAARRPVSTSGRRPTVVISLGGGRHAAAGVVVASALAAIRPSRARILLSLGLDSGVRQRHTVAPVGVEILTPDRLGSELARATVAVVAGGMTLYETGALGTPAVAVAVVPGQRATVAAFGQAGFARTPAGPRRPAGQGAAWGAAVAAAVVDLWHDGAARRTMAAASRRAIDGQGADRVARAIRRLIDETKARGT